MLHGIVSDSNADRPEGSMVVGGRWMTGRCLKRILFR